MTASSSFLILSLLSAIAASIGSPSQRIINGAEVKVGEIPFQISIQTSNYDHYCSGSIITSYYVLTAAHCVKKFTSDDLIIIANIVNLKLEGSKHKVVDIIVHEDYDADNSWVNDIALLKSETPFDVNMFGILPEPFEDPKVGYKAIVSGWGLTENGGMSEVLKKAEIYISKQDECKEAYTKIHQTIHPTQVCANNPKFVTGACNADSGGPMTVNNKLVGIVSWSNDCASTYYPTVFTRVSHYMDWILKHVPLIRPSF